jgi:cell division inhibitor SepF
MASMWRKAMLYLGLGPDEDYDDYEVLGNSASAPSREPVRRPMPNGPRDPDMTGAVRTLGSSSHDALTRDGRDRDRELRDLRDGRDSGVGPPTNGHSPRGLADRQPAGGGYGGPGGYGSSGPGPGPAQRARPVVRPVTVAAAKPHVVAPAAFTDAQEVADEFKRNVPVIVNLQGVERDLMRRIIDFASGLCYGLDGQMERVATHVYLLTPSDVEVSPEERRRWRDRGNA